MKAYLSFNLPEENYEHDLALNGYKYKTVIDELDNVLRETIKYDATELTNGCKPSSTQLKLIENIRNLIVHLKQDNGVVE